MISNIIYIDNILLVYNIETMNDFILYSTSQLLLHITLKIKGLVLQNQNWLRGWWTYWDVWLQFP